MRSTYSYILQDDPEEAHYNADTVITLKEFPNISMALAEIFADIGILIEALKSFDIPYRQKNYAYTSSDVNAAWTLEVGEQFEYMYRLFFFLALKR